MAFKTFNEAAENFFASVDPKIDAKTAFYSGAICGLLVMMQAKDDAHRNALEREILDYMRSRQP